MQKNIKILVLLIIVSSGSLYSQEKSSFLQRHFLSFSVGPSFATNKQPNITVEQKPDGTETKHYQDVGYGKGFSFALGYTFMINNFLGLELNATKLIGGDVLNTNIYYFKDPVNPYAVRSKKQILC